MTEEPRPPSRLAQIGRNFEQVVSLSMERSGSKATLYCSFCGKSNHEIKHLVAGPTAFICDECVALCTEIIKEKEGEGGR